MPRDKRTAWPARAAYRALAVLARVVGPRRALKVTLGAARVFSRFSFELAGRWYGPPFHCATMALSEDVLRQWVPAGGTVLDVGCGTGRWSRVAARLAGEVVGVDLDASNVEQARAATSASNVTFLVGDVTRDLADRRFDVALAIHLLEHIDDPVGLLKSLAQRAATLVVEVPDFEADPLNHVRRERGLRFDSDADHVREYTIDSLRSQLAAAGWSPRHEAKRGGAILVVATREPGQLAVVR